MENLRYRLESFEGPLDLLLHLVEKNKVKITDIPIALIFEQYMKHIELMRHMDMDVAGEFIVMASELMLIKSRMLLPHSEETDDPRARLASALIEYQRMKAAAGYLAERFDAYAGRFTKDTDEVKPDTDELIGQDAEQLRRAMLSLLKSLDKEQSENAARLYSERPFEKILRAPIVPVTGRIFGILRCLIRQGDTLYTSILLTARSKSELIATFLAMLELIKKNRVTLRPVGEYDFGDLPHDYMVILTREKQIRDEQ